MLKRLAPLLGALVLFACDGGGGTVTIAAAGPWNEGFGLMNRRGVQMAVAEINARHLVRGRTLVLVDRDDKAEGSTAAAVAQEFVANRDIVAVVGHVTSGAQMAAAKVYDGHLASVATSATSPDLTGISPWAFRVIASDSTNGLDLAHFAERLGRSRAAILYENDSYGRGLTQSFRRNFAGTIVSIDPISADTRDFEPFVSYFKRVKPDIVFVAGTEQGGMAVLREAKRQQLDAVFLGGDGWTGIVADSVASEGAYVGAPFSPMDPRPEAQAFAQKFRAKYGVDADGNAANGYDATMLVARAIDAVGPDRRKIRDWLAKLGEREPVAGVAGALRFQKNGDPIGKTLVMTRVHDGKLLVEGRR